MNVFQRLGWNDVSTVTRSRVVWHSIQTGCIECKHSIPQLCNIEVEAFNFYIRQISVISKFTLVAKLMKHCSKFFCTDRNNFTVRVAWNSIWHFVALTVILVDNRPMRAGFLWCAFPNNIIMNMSLVDPEGWYLGH